jgi:hypothetical protein
VARYPPTAKARAVGSGLHGQRRSGDPLVMGRSGGDASQQGGAPVDGRFLRQTTQSVNQR